ncbi:hypothetical protein SAMN02745213_01833 [Succinivibrio dextrinosolvens DSM 3072]|uniref:Uncharacterized protein n=1 Tax=Succinivibrio dextrinosolvens DSM 3072 TaxID=1123324 RepID=A0A1T4VNW9_9GAMM|nr:hypothetical protein [Succinivibrio dextrinosolvens]SKA66548.1 hypothetical protein SAMN02745213_01833 [Succinivibrio dextrinosolvens DSM 3072]
MDGSEIKNVSHNNSSELSLLISALEEQQKRTVTTLKTDNSHYSKKLDEIFNPTVPTSEIVPEKENLSTSDLFNQKFKNAQSVIDSKLDIVLDVEKYLNELKDSVNKLTSDGDNQASVSNVTRSIEGISSIVADLTSTKSSSSELKSALSKLPAFDESGNIVSAESSNNTATPPEEVPFELTPQTEELSIDEAFAQAQKEALAQLEQDKELETQLKEDAQRLNQSLRDSSINIEAVINPETPVQEKHELLENEDDHYIQNIDEDTDKDLQSSDGNDEKEKTVLPSAKSDETIASDIKKGTAVTYVAGFFEGNNKEVTEIIPEKLESLALVLSEVENGTSESAANNQSLENSNLPDALPPALQQALDSSLNGIYGQNVNAASENGMPVQTGAYSTNISDNTEALSDSLALSEYSDNTVSTIPADASFTPVADEDEAEEDSRIEAVRVSDLKAVDNSNQNASENNSLIDGNPKIVRESTLKLIEAERQFENRRLGRKLEPKDFYYKVEQTDPWFQTILKSGYNDGPVFSALCYSKRIIDPNNEYNWKLQISTDFELMTSAPDFHHNLRTRFSFVLNHPVEIEFESYKGIPPGCPEELARMWFVREIENAKNEIAQNEELNNLLMKLGENIKTLNISIYTQNSLPKK